MKNVAVILAGGLGLRFNAGCGSRIDTPKQFIKIAGKSVIEHTIDIFEKNVLIDEIAVVTPSLFIADIEGLLASNGWIKVKKILVGGKERYDSSMVAIDAYEGECNMLFHDAVRPLVSDRIINDVVKALEKYNAVGVAIPVTDTIVQIEDDFIRSIPDRKIFRRMQTPQGFKLSTIKQAYKTALADKEFVTTDDCGVVVKYQPNEKVFIINGEESNIKLTYKEDFYILEKLLKQL
jgi:2-C-methyl-D-erythritol 4-phosphate cytidylyltransferase